MRWFGDLAGPAYEPQWKADTPVGDLCVHCVEAIVDGEPGVLMLGLRRDRETTGLEWGPTFEGPMHFECHMRGIIGSVGHQNGRCSCFGGTEEDPPGMTIRQAAVAALQQFEMDGLRGHRR